MQPGENEERVAVSKRSRPEEGTNIGNPGGSRPPVCRMDDRVRFHIARSMKVVSNICIAHI